MREEWRGAYLQGVVFFAPMSLSPPLPQSGRRRGGIGLLLPFFLLRSPYLPPHSTLLQDPTLLLLLLLLFQLSHGRGFSVRRRLLFHHRLFLRRRSPESAYSQGRRRGKCFSAEWKWGGCPILSGRRRRRTAKVLRRGLPKHVSRPSWPPPAAALERSM